MAGDPTHQNRQKHDSRPRILLAEDDREMREMLSFVLWRAGYAVEAMSDGVSLLQRLSEAGTASCIDWDLVISDIRMPGVNGIEILEYLHSRADLPPLLLITAFGNNETHDLAQRLGAVTLIDKPFDLEFLLHEVQRVILPHAE